MKIRGVLLIAVAAAWMIVSVAPASASNITETNITASVDPVTCQMTITWTTNVKSSTKVYYGTSCGSLSNSVTGTDCVTSHSVSFDVSSYGDVAIYFKVESGTNCETELSSCQSKRRGNCTG